MNTIKVLDKGFVTILEHMGDDHSICEAARISTGSQSNDPERDRKLIHRLWKDNHTSPFEMVVFKFHIKLPIFTMRELVRHRTAKLNEMSGRYRELPHEAYIPSTNRLQPQSKKNKQGSEEGQLIATKHFQPDLDDPVNIQEAIQENMILDQQDDFVMYSNYLATGLSRELARINLPLSTYTEIIWQMDLRNLLHFLKLRMAPDAQWEIQEYARAIYELIKPIVPYTVEAFEEYTLHSKTLSKSEVEQLANFAQTVWNEDYLRAEGEDFYDNFNSFMEKLGLLKGK